MLQCIFFSLRCIQNQNLSFDFANMSNNPIIYSNKNSYLPIDLFSKPNVFPQSAIHGKKQTNQNPVSPLNKSLSPRKRLFSSKQPNKLNSSKQIQPLTIKTGTSIEALKDLIGPNQIYSASNQTHNQTYNSQLKYLLSVHTEKYQKNRQPVFAQINVSNSIDQQTQAVKQAKRQINSNQTADLNTRNDSSDILVKKQQKTINNRSNSKDQKSPINFHKKNYSYQLESSKAINEQDLSATQQTILKQQQKPEWKNQKLPLTPSETIEKFENLLTGFEKQEINTFKRIYYIGGSTKKIDNQKVSSNSIFNDGFDNSKGEYNYKISDHIGYRYEILEDLGKGSFGQVVRVLDHKNKVQCALKIIRNKKKFQNQALVELKILTFIKEKDEENLTNIVKIQDFVIFRNHVVYFYLFISEKCIVFEILSMNLYELIKSNHYSGLSLELIRRFAIQILNALNFLYKYRIVHCDLKPENILLKQANKSGIKIIDFGSSCFENERIYTYIQSRYYRAPEVILGLPYEMGIDMWSFGCIMAELFMGYPIFPGENEQEQMAYIMEVLGEPRLQFIEDAPRKKYFYNSQGQALPFTNSRGKIRVPNSKDLKQVLKCSDELFVDFLHKCFIWEPENRMKPLEALMHSWILEGLPPEIRVQHVKYLESEKLNQKNFFKTQKTSNQNDDIQKNKEKNNPAGNFNKLQFSDQLLYNLLNRNSFKQHELTPQHKRILSNSFHQKQSQMKPTFPGSTKHDAKRQYQY